jgi:hypothetical protein
MLGEAMSAMAAYWSSQRYNKRQASLFRRLAERHEAEARALVERAEKTRQDRERVVDSVLDVWDWMTRNQDEQEKQMSTTQKIDLSKTYKTRGGDEVKLYAIDESLGDYPVVGAKRVAGSGFTLERWTLDGRYLAHEESHRFDLIEIKPKHIIYINIYPNGTKTIYTTQLDADRTTAVSRVACNRIELEEGRFDD